jgi:hypothetical protein
LAFSAKRLVNEREDLLSWTKSRFCVQVLVCKHWPTFGYLSDSDCREAAVDSQLHWSLVDENDVRDDLLPVVLWTDGRRLLFLVYGSEGVAAVQRIR